MAPNSIFKVYHIVFSLLFDSCFLCSKDPCDNIEPAQIIQGNPPIWRYFIYYIYKVPFECKIHRFWGLECGHFGEALILSTTSSFSYLLKYFIHCCFFSFIFAPEFIFPHAELDVLVVSSVAPVGGRVFQSTWFRKCVVTAIILCTWSYYALTLKNYALFSTLGMGWEWDLPMTALYFLGGQVSYQCQKGAIILLIGLVKEDFNQRWLSS